MASMRRCAREDGAPLRRCEGFVSAVARPARARAPAAVAPTSEEVLRFLWTWLPRAWLPSWRKSFSFRGGFLALRLRRQRRQFDKQRVGAQLRCAVAHGNEIELFRVGLITGEGEGNRGRRSAGQGERAGRAAGLSVGRFGFGARRFGFETNRFRRRLHFEGMTSRASSSSPESSSNLHSIHTRQAQCQRIRSRLLCTSSLTRPVQATRTARPSGKDTGGLRMAQQAARL